MLLSTLTLSFSILLLTLIRFTINIKVVKFEVGDLIYEKAADVLNENINNSENLILTNYEDTRFLPIALTGKGIHTLTHPCTLVHSDIVKSDSISTINGKLAIFCADNSKRKMSLLYNQNSEILKLKTISYPASAQYTRVYLGSLDIFIML